MIALDEKVNDTGDNGGNGKQEMQYFDHYLTKDLAALFDSDANIDSKLLAACKQIVLLQATRMTELSFAHCFAIACHREVAMGPGGDTALQRLRGFKQLVHKAAGKDAPMGLPEYPKDVNEFFNKLPDAYNRAFPCDQPPAKSGFDSQNPFVPEDR